METQAELSLDSAGKPTRIFGTIQDISERKRHEIEKAMLEEQIRNTVLDGIIAIGPDLRIKNLNYAAEAFFGVHSSEVIGKTLNELCGTERKTIAETVHRFFSSKRYVREYQVSGGTGHTAWACAIGVAPMLNRNQPEAMVFIRDITHLRPSVSIPLSEHSFASMVGQSPRMLEIFKLIQHLEEIDSTVLIQGPSGTGKELVASALHNHSSRRGGPYIRVNCAALPENLLESELFGHIRGAFTGAVTNKVGRFELANQGTIFLDEIGDISANMQKRLLRVLQEREIERVGETKTIPIDVRILAATNRDLADLVNKGRFREDLFYRLKVITIELPALKDRLEDIPLLVNHFFKKYRSHFGRNIHEISSEVLDILQSYDWPGNIRQLENVMEHAVAMTRGNKIEKYSLPHEILSLHLESKPLRSDAASQTPPESIAANENSGAQALQELLDSVGWNRTKAAQILKVNRNTIWRKIKKYGLIPPQYR